MLSIKSLLIFPEAVRLFLSLYYRLISSLWKDKKDDGYWCEGVGSALNGTASSKQLEDAAEWTSPPCYVPSADCVCHLPYPPIVDNTEGIAAFHDIDFPDTTKYVADFGAGASDAPHKFLQCKMPGVEVFALDPFNRRKDHNELTQSAIKKLGGMQVVTAMSVLNIIPQPSERFRLISTMHKALRAGGLAYFKVWAGSWPARGRGVSAVDFDTGVFQANKWASAFEGEVAAVFGIKNVFTDNNTNLIVARKC